ncbi:hypothetical protein CDAR_318901 [Caerostris darwini]|uniref:Uncharacterized protein n=1 Tax=Caerostris darwini TaxID=1538125 RepID=A0AAV4TXJ7_9ARAC|nr:hypothetical protein CDAR_318901 [Caerostris darwini]
MSRFRDRLVFSSSSTEGGQGRVREKKMGSDVERMREKRSEHFWARGRIPSPLPSFSSFCGFAGEDRK